MKGKHIAMIVACGVTFISVIIVCIYFIISIMILGRVGNTREELFSISISPNNQITLEAYRDAGSATVDYTIRVYVKDETRKKLIYNAYHENKVTINWITDTTVEINGTKLNLSKEQTYDWRSGVKPR